MLGLFKGGRENKAVSPVIGVILMVAITLVLAAVISSFVFGISSKAVRSTPNVKFSISAVNESGVDRLIITDLGGDVINGTDLSLIIYYDNGTLYKTVNPLNPDQGTIWKAGLSNTSISVVGNNVYTAYLVYKPTNNVIYEGKVNAP